MESSDNIKKPFGFRFWQYQKERFPVFAHGLLIVSFTFSAVSYSRLSRGVETFIPFRDFWPGAIVVFCLFLLMRILDEHKDRKNDARYRAYLPVPRGLVSLKELRMLGIVLIAVQLLIILVYQWALLPLYLLTMVFLALMTVEFFVPDWLNERPLLYMFSHMLIIPLIDLYSSGMDWELNGFGFHNGLWLFLAASFFNGTVLEVGRKIRVPEHEEPGVKSYSQALGSRAAAVFWLCLLTVTYGLAFWAMSYAHQGLLSKIILTLFYVALAVPGVLFAVKPAARLEAVIEKASGIWTIAMYLILGGVPMLIKSYW